MKCILMNKNTQVLKLEYNTTTNSIDKIYEIYNLEYGPLAFVNVCNNKVGNRVKALNDWFRGRGIPEWRKDIEVLLNNLKIDSPDELLNKSYGLSLSDQYWIKEEGQNISWKDINFFTNDFQYKAYFDASFSSSSNINVDLKSPNNTTDGMLQKAWVIENGKRVLVKGTYSPSRQEPINEWIVSKICQKLGIDYCNYEIEVNGQNIFSKCIDFINENEEIVSAYEIFELKPKSNNVNDLTHYISILEENGIENAKSKLEDMILVDYIVMNFDRHMRNFGIIRNVENLKWEKVTPIFDTGEALQCNKILNAMNFKDDKCKFFNNTNKDFSSLLQYVDLSRYDFSKLEDIPDMLKEKLIEYKEYTDMSDERIDKIYEGIKYRIQGLLTPSLKN